MFETFETYLHSQKDHSPHTIKAYLSDFDSLPAGLKSPTASDSRPWPSPAPTCANTATTCSTSKLERQYDQPAIGLYIGLFALGCG